MKIALVGSAPSWQKAPFGDPSWDIWAMNDLYLKGLPRATAWFELHQFDRLLFLPEGWPDDRAIIQPPNRYPRPHDHFAQLAALGCLVFVQPQDVAAAQEAGIMNARPFPFDAAQAVFPAPYVASSAAWLLLYAMARVDMLPRTKDRLEVGIYGIDMTHGDYQYERPNFECLLGFAVGRGVTITLPKGCALMSTSHRYALEPDPIAIPMELMAAQVEAHQARDQTLTALKRAPWWMPASRFATRLNAVDHVLAEQQTVMRELIQRKRGTQEMTV